MDKNICSVLDVKRSFLITKSVKCLLNEFQGVYGEKLRRLECEVKGSQEEILRMKVRILHSYVNDLNDQNEILVHTVEELEKEADEKLSHLKEKLQTSEEGIKDLAHQRKLLEEDNKSLRAEIRKLKLDTRTLTRVIHEAQRAYGPDVTGLTLRPQTPESVSERPARSTRLSQKSSDFMKAQLEDLQNQLKTKNRIIQHLEEEMKTLSSHKVQVKNKNMRAVEALECKEEVCKPSEVQKRTHTHTEIHKTERRLSAAQNRQHETRRQLTELLKQYKQKQKEVEKLQEVTTKHEVLMKKMDEELQREISERRNLELDFTVISEKHRTAQQESSSQDLVILKLRAELQVSLEKNQEVQEELGLQEGEVSRLNEKVRKQQAHLQELREMCRHGNAQMGQEEHKTQQLQSQLQLAQQQLKRLVKRAERLQEELTASRLDHAADAERWTQRNLLLHAEVQQLQEQNLHHTQLLREHAEKIRQAERMQHLHQEKVTEHEEILKKRDSEIRHLTQHLQEIQDEVQKSKKSSQSHRSIVEIFKQKYITAMEKVQQLQVQLQRAEEEAELSQKQLVEAQVEVSSLRAETSGLESRYERNVKRAALSEEAVELLTDKLQVALDSLRNCKERNLQREEEMEEFQIRMKHQQKLVEKEGALVRDELENTHLTLQTRSEELQKVHEEMRRAIEEKTRKENENEVLKNELKQLGHQLQQLVCFFTDAAEQEGSSAVFIPSPRLPSREEQLNDSPEAKEEIPPPLQLHRLTVEELRVEAGVSLRSLQEVADETETLRRLICETAGERDEAREQLQHLKQDLEETRAENAHLHQEREQLVTNINLWITEHKAANESLAARIKQQNELLTSVSLERENEQKKRLEHNLRQIDAIQARLRSNMESVMLLNRQLSSMSKENTKNKKLLMKEKKQRSHLEMLLGSRINQSLVPPHPPPSLKASDQIELAPPD